MEFGLIGERLGHSYSAEIHRAFGAYDYELKSMPPEAVGPFLKDKSFRGINVTIPYKKAVIPYCDEISATAQKIGSVNTIVKRADGSLFGDNTDYAGFSAMAARAGISFAGRKVAILGSGGTSLTARTVAADEGAREVVVVSRSGAVNYGDLSPVADSDIVINTTPIGMYPNNGEAVVSLDTFPNCCGVIDVIYNPLRTALISQACERGIPYTGGLYMLTAQAAFAYERFIGETLAPSVLDRVYRELLQSVENVILVGMPGSGKTTVGKLVAERLGREVVDLDAVVAERAGMSVPEIFAAQGEAVFRKMAADAAADFGKQKGLVIAGGGGIILTAVNRAALRQNGRVYCLERPLESLSTANRPLSKDLETLKQMAEARAPLYALASDVTVPNNRTAADAAAAILEDFYEAACY